MSGVIVVPGGTEQIPSGCQGYNVRIDYNVWQCMNTTEYQEYQHARDLKHAAETKIFIWLLPTALIATFLIVGFAVWLSNRADKKRMQKLEKELEI